MEEKIIQILIQGGLASVALVSVYLNFKIVSNHMHESSEVMRGLTAVIGELKELLRSHIKTKN